MTTEQQVSLAYLRANDNWEKAVIVFSNNSWKDGNYSLEARSYEVSRDNKYFSGIAIGNSLFGSALDGSDDLVRLDHYLHDWEIEYIYLVK